MNTIHSVGISRSTGSAMKSRSALKLFLLQAIAVFFTEVDADSTFSRSSYFTTQENKQLKGYVVKRFDSSSLLSCNQQCMRNTWCTSTNYKMSSKKDGKGTCELNKHDISLVDVNAEFADQQGVTFSMLLKGCLITSCLNGGSCFHDNENNTFSCSCKQPWTGDSCEVKKASSCKELYDNGVRENKAYKLQTDSGENPVYCHMTSDVGKCGGGGWTLVMKIDGNKQTFHYDSDFWKNKKEFNLPGGETGFDSQETKLPTYWETQFSKICLGMKYSQQIRFIVINKHADSLYSLIADGHHRATSLSREKWKSLLGPEGSLQRYCNLQGFNAAGAESDQPKARIGIVGNEQNDCNSPDSRIGFGTGGLHDVNNTCGNDARYSPDNGDKHIKAFGYIFVQ